MYINLKKRGKQQNIQTCPRVQEDKGVLGIWNKNRK